MHQLIADGISAHAHNATADHDNLSDGSLQEFGPASGGQVADDQASLQANGQECQGLDRPGGRDPR
jgi:hypothetical protein